MKTAAPVLAVLVASALVGTPALAGVVYVDQQATGSDDGTSWLDAFVDLQDALASAVAADSIWVAAGTYLPTDSLDASIAFELADGITLLGGFEGTETAAIERDWVLNPTILSGDLGVPVEPSLARAAPRPDRGADPIVHQAWFANRSASLLSTGVDDNSWSVVSADSTDSTAVLDGFIIRHGYNPDSGVPDGAGLKLEQASPTLANLVVEFNRSVGPGAGIAIDGGAPRLRDCRFYQNDTAYIGGGLYATAISTVELDGVEFEDNYAQISGGAAWVGGGPLTMYGGSVIDNNAQDAVAGIYCSDDASFIGVVFEGNTSFAGNGALSLAGSLVIDSCRIVGNRSSFPSQAAAAGVNAGGSAMVRNSLFAANEVLAVVPPSFSSRYWVGGLRSVGSLELLHCTFAANSANYAGGFSHSGADTVRLRNSIVWSNSSFFGSPGGRADTPGQLLVSSSDLQGSGSSAAWIASAGTDLGGNLDIDPLFADVALLDLRPELGSPVIDTADLQAVPLGLGFDLGGALRINGPGVDMGAYEFQGPTLDALFAATLRPRLLDLRQSQAVVKLSLVSLWTVEASRIDPLTVVINGTLAPINGSAALAEDRLDFLLPRGELILGAAAGATLPLLITGELDNGVQFTATDTVQVIRGRRPREVQSDPLVARPNPFNPVTTISYRIPSDGRAELVVYDLAGRRVRTLLTGSARAGAGSVKWDGTDDSGRQVASGVYLYQLRTPDLIETRRLVLVK